jgi:uncharacterized protein (TIGR02996 family)
VSDRRQELYEAVLNDPDNLEPRLEMARWLDEQGDPQGEFIRLQIAAAKEPGRIGSRRYAELCEAADKLLAVHGAKWANSITCLSAEPFKRGFVESVSLTAREFLADADRLYKLAPIRHLVLKRTSEVIDDFVESRNLDRIVSLFLTRNDLDDDSVAKLARSRHLYKLKSLNLGFNKIGEAGLHALCASDGLPSLLYVNLAGNAVETPVESYGTDWRDMQIVKDGAHLDERGRAFEARYGYRKWFHGPSELPNYPPWEDEL